MHIDGGQPWRGQHGIRQNQAIGGDNQHIRPQSSQLSLSLVIFQALRLERRQTQFPRQTLDRGRRQLVTAPGGAVRLRVYRNNFAARPLRKRLEDHPREIWRAHEN